MHLGKQFNSNRFKKPNIDKTNYIKDRKSFGFGEDIFDFDDALKSVDISCLEFTNFFHDRKDVKYKFVKKEYNRLLNQQIDLDTEYEMKLVNTEDGFNRLKLEMIYSDTLGKEVRAFPLMYKLKNLSNEELQFYVKNENGKYKVCFIDIFHLAIPTKYQDTKAIYEINSCNRYGLEHLKEEKLKVTN